MRVQLVVDFEGEDDFARLPEVAEAVAGVAAGESQGGSAEAAAPKTRRRRGQSSDAASAEVPLAGSGTPTGPASSSAAAAQITPPATAPAPAPSVAPASPAPADPLAGGAAPSGVTKEALATLASAVIAKYGAPDKALEVTKKYGSTSGAIGELAEANYPAVAAELQALLA